MSITSVLSLFAMACVLTSWIPNAAAQTTNLPSITIDSTSPLVNDRTDRTLPSPDSITVWDADLSDTSSGERVELSVVAPSWVSLQSAVLEPRHGDSVRRVAITYERSDSVGPHPVVIVARDAAGATDTARSVIYTSLPVDWAIPVVVELTRPGGERFQQRLVLGQARHAWPSTLSLGEIRIDTAYGEIELPPLDSSLSFDARWNIDSSDGVRRSINSSMPMPGERPLYWRALIHGFEPSSGEPSDTLRIRWLQSDINRVPTNIVLILGDTTQTARVLTRLPLWEYNRLPADRSSYLQISGDTVTFVTADPAARSELVFVHYLEIHATPLDREVVSLSCAPMPFSVQTTITVEARRATPVRIDIIDPMGRCVRAFADDRLLSGARRYLWDGLDEAGATVPSGIYHLLVRADDEIARTTVVVAR